MNARVFSVHGPPGTGKTTYLAHQARRAADEYGAANIVIASLTRAAAAEIAGRDTGVPDDRVGTMHAHAYRTLDRPPLAEAPDALRAFNDAHPERAIHPSAGGDLEDATVDPDPSVGQGTEAHQRMNVLRARMVPRERWAPDVLAHTAVWEAWKREHELMDFTDLIERTIADGPHRDLPNGILLDETQDFSPLELRLATTWARWADTTVMAGDVDQTLYAFRGADPTALERLPVAGRRVLEQSHRVPAAVHAYATRWISQIPGRQPVAYQPTAEPGMVASAPWSLRYPEPLLARVEQDLAAGAEVMVLASCGYMLSPLLALLRRGAVAFHNPYRARHGGWNPLRGARRLLAFLRPDRAVWGEHARMWTWEDLRLWTDPLDARRALARGTKQHIELKCSKDRFGETQAHEPVPLAQLQTLLNGEDALNAALDVDVGWWDRMLRATQRKAAEYPLAVSRRHGAAALRDQPRLVVGSVHSVKGGEADVVYLAGDLSRQGYWNGWCAGGAARDSVTRMGYVGMTRARQRLVLLKPSGPEHAPFPAAPAVIT